VYSPDVRPLRVALVVCAVAGVVRPPGAGPQRAPTAGDPDYREIAAYRLTLDATAKVLRVTHAMVEELRKDPRVQERIQLESELTALERKEAPIPAEVTRIDDLRARREALDKEEVQPKALSQAQTLREMEAAVKQYQPLSRPLAQERMTPREFGKFFLALIQASLAASLQQAGMLKELPPDVSRENVQFVLEHQEELQKIQQEFQTLGGAESLIPRP
jgi:hypothetical protein